MNLYQFNLYFFLIESSKGDLLRFSLFVESVRGFKRYFSTISRQIASAERNVLIFFIVFNLVLRFEMMFSIPFVVGGILYLPTRIV